MEKLLVLVFAKLSDEAGCRPVVLRATYVAVAMHTGHISFSALDCPLRARGQGRTLTSVRTDRQCASVGAAVPSDQVGTCIMNTVNGSGEP